MRYLLIVLLSVGAMLGSIMLARADDQLLQGFGAEVNPTGEPIGGGMGYTAGPKRTQATCIVTTLDELTRALKQAQPGEVIWLDVLTELDFTGVRLEVPERVTLAGDRGQNGSPGALLFAKYQRTTEFPVFIILHPGARLTGVRVRGSNPLFPDLDQQPSDADGYAVSCINAEIDNCEISQFRRGGVSLFRDSDRSYIHHNYLHDIAAYPVFIGLGTGAGHVIEANRIDWAWHAVGSAGSRGSGYTARYNEFVRVVRPKLFESSGSSPPNWCLDVHTNEGAQTTPPRPAERKLIVHHNTFRAVPELRVGNGSELLSMNGIYPKYDIYVGFGDAMLTRVQIRGNRFLMHATSGSSDKFKPYGRAIRIEGLRGHPTIDDDPLPLRGELKVEIGTNRFSGR